MSIYSRQLGGNTILVPGGTVIPYAYVLCEPVPGMTQVVRDIQLDVRNLPSSGDAYVIINNDSTVISVGLLYVHGPTADLPQLYQWQGRLVMQGSDQLELVGHSGGSGGEGVVSVVVSGYLLTP